MHIMVIAERRVNLKWWETLSINEQEKYIEEHPTSPYRKYLQRRKSAKKKQDEKEAKRKAKEKEGNDAGDSAEEELQEIKLDLPDDEAEPQTKFDETKDLKDLNYNEQINVEVKKDVKKESISENKKFIEKSESEIDAEIDDKLKNVKKLSEAMKNFNDEQKAFFREGQQKPDSNFRRSLGQAFRDKTKGLAKALKEEVHEWKTAAGAMKTIMKGGKLDHHQKGALKSVAIHSALVVLPAAATGGLSTGLMALPSLAFGFLEHSLVLSAGRAAIWANVDENMRDPDSYDDDELLEMLIGKLADGIESAPISNRDWIKAVMKGNIMEEKKKEELAKLISGEQNV